MQPVVIGIPVQHAAQDAARYDIAANYAQAIVQAGGVPLLIPLIEPGDGLKRLLGLCQGLLLAGGGDIAPAEYGSADGHLVRGVDGLRDRVELHLARWALGTMPVLGICRGIQLLNVAAGGTLLEDIPSQVGNAIPHQTPSALSPATLRHAVSVVARSRLAEALGLADGQLEKTPVNSTHHQAVRRLAPGFVATAVAPDGVIEAIEHQGCGPFTCGVQWHPERLVPGYRAMEALFASFVRACGS